MRILIHAVAPWCASGYGKQSGITARIFADLGHDVAISAHYGLQGSPIVWNGIPVLPGGDAPWGEDVVGPHADHFEADVVLVLGDLWIMDPGPFRDLAKRVKLAAWVPVDCDPAGSGDVGWLRETAATPIAMSSHGQQMLTGAGLPPLYVPHAIDCTVFSPRPRPDSDVFLIGMNAANNDYHRKGFAEQFEAFARLKRKHSDVRLLVHSRASNLHARGLNLYALAEATGIEKDVSFVSQYEQAMGMVPDEAMADWYSSLDLLSNCSMGEGFGLPIVEAQASGCPVVVTRASSMTELCGRGGWSVEGERFWNPRHQAFWVKPSVSQIARAYERAYDGAERLRDHAREFALQYDIETVKPLWEKALESL